MIGSPPDGGAGFGMAARTPDVDEYLIEFSVRRRRDGEDDFSEIGFGSSGAWSGVDQALYAVQSTVQNRQWETESEMPDPGDAA